MVACDLLTEMSFIFKSQSLLLPIVIGAISGVIICKIYLYFSFRKSSSIIHFEFAIGIFNKSYFFSLYVISDGILFLQISQSNDFQVYVIQYALIFFTLFVIIHFCKHLKCINAIVPEHSQIDNNGS